MGFLSSAYSAILILCSPDSMSLFTFSHRTPPCQPLCSMQGMMRIHGTELPSCVLHPVTSKDIKRVSNYSLCTSWGIVACRMWLLCRIFRIESDGIGSRERLWPTTPQNATKTWRLGQEQFTGPARLLTSGTCSACSGRTTAMQLCQWTPSITCKESWHDSA